MAMSKKVKQTISLFVVTFLISLIVITYFIKSMSPNVDVEIGDSESNSVAQEDTDSDIKQAIDDRLRWIQMEDNMPGVSKRDDGTVDEVSYEQSEKVKQTKVKNEKDNALKQENKSEEEQSLEPIEYVSPQKQITQPPVPLQTTKTEPFKMSKVYVGSYPTIEQAIQAQNKLMNTNVSVSPFVKEVNGVYVLQAGSYANANKAEAVSREINAVGFHARVVKE